MKITDIIEIKKLEKAEKHKHFNRYVGLSSAQDKQFEKKGYTWRGDIVCYHRAWFLNNVDKDIVVGYLKDRFCSFILVKKQKEYRALRWVDVGRLNIGAFNVFAFSVISDDDLVEIIKEYKDFQIVDEKEYELFMRKRLLEKIENGD